MGVRYIYQKGNIMVGKSIVHKNTGSVGIVTEYHPIPENSELTGVIKAIYPGDDGSAPTVRTYIEKKGAYKDIHGREVDELDYELIDSSNS